MTAPREKRQPARAGFRFEGGSAGQRLLTDKQEDFVSGA
jgi:hypothetical protein